MTEPKQVLILDDSPIVLAMLQKAIAGAGMRPLLAADLAEFEQRIAESPDLLVMDINLPEVYGDDVAAVVRHVRGLNVPIILFSGLDEPELARRAAEAGIDAYITKNAGVARLVERVVEMLS